MNLICIKNKKNLHVSQETVIDFEEALIQNKNVFIIKRLNSAVDKVLCKLFKKKIFNNPFSQRTKSKIIINFSILMGTEFNKCISHFLFSSNNSVYLFDAWSIQHEQIERFIKNFNLSTVFFSSQQVTEIFKQKNLNCQFHWIPEAIVTNRYKYYDYKNKNIDVLQFGRKYDGYHDKIVKHLDEKKYLYLYEKVKGEIVFDTNDEFIEGLARTKISICIPSNITHPERAGNISTMTVRYLQSMASKCLVLGIMPAEMKEIFNYEAVVPVNLDDPFNQINDILNNFERYIPLIERNYENVKQYHQWENRSDEIIRILDKLNDTI